jgi:hypothetical protein
MVNQNTQDIDLSELDQLKDSTTEDLWSLFVKAVNLHADPANVAGGDAMKQTKLKAAIEEIVS